MAKVPGLRRIQRYLREVRADLKEYKDKERSLLGAWKDVWADGPNGIDEQLQKQPNQGNRQSNRSIEQG